MSLLATIRHGATDWNAERRLQGRADRPLSAHGRSEVKRWNVPPLLRHACWLTSPLARAKDTASLLGHPDCGEEPALIEMAWGDWEGRTRAELVAEFGSQHIDGNPLGRDFSPPNGESPRQVWDRLTSWVSNMARLGRPVVAVRIAG